MSVGGGVTSSTRAPEALPPAAVPAHARARGDLSISLALGVVGEGGEGVLDRMLSVTCKPLH